MRDLSPEEEKRVKAVLTALVRLTKGDTRVKVPRSAIVAETARYLALSEEGRAAYDAENRKLLQEHRRGLLEKLKGDGSPQ